MSPIKATLKNFAGGSLVQFLIVGSIFAMGPSYEALDSKQARPNIFVVMTDDQGFTQLDPTIVGRSIVEEVDDAVTELFAGDPGALRKAARDSMPTLRELAQDGIRFSDATVPIPVCSPSRVGFITGAYPQRLGIYSNDDIVRSGTDTRATFLSEVLQEQGYATAIVGKWHMGEYRREALETDSVDYHRWNRVSMRAEDHPFQRGFDRYFGFTASGSNFYDPSSLFDGWDPVSETEYLTDAFTREALAFIDSRSNDQPFFLFLAYNAPHIPVYEPAPEAYREPFDTGNPAVDNYYAKIRAIDVGIEQLRERLKERGEWDNTFFVFFSDNGAVADSPHPRNAPLRGFKGLLHQGGIRVPMVWKLPESSGIGPQLFQAPVSSMDILPTAIALAGISYPKNSVDGIDLLPDILGTSSRSKERHLFFAGSHAGHWGDENLDFWNAYTDYLERGDPTADHPQSQLTERFGPGGLSVRHGDYSLIWDADAGDFRLFNLREDIGEARDLSSQKPEQVAEMKAVLGDWLRGLPSPTDWNRNYWHKMIEAVDQQ